MTHVGKMVPILAVLVAAVLLGAPSKAHATFEITVAEGAQSVTDVYTGASLPTEQIIFNQAVGNFNVNVDVAASNSASDTEPALLTINSLAISFASGPVQTLTITIWDDGFMAPSVGVQSTMTSQLSTTQLPTGALLTFQSFINGTGGTPLSLSNVGGVSTNDTVIIPSSMYTLEEVLTISTPPMSDPWIQATGLTSVASPAPPGIVVALTGVPFLALGWLLRRRMRQA